MNFSEAFARYGAKLKNVQWAVSAIHDDELIVSCWQHLFKSPGDNTQVYEDRLSRFSGPGNNLLRQHIERAVNEKLPVRVVVAISSNPEAVTRGEDASKYKNRFFVKEDWIGEIDKYDGDFVRFVFRQKA